MSEPGLLGLYWGARQEPLDACARRVHDSLRALAALGYARYFFRGRSRKDAEKRELELTLDAVLATLAKGVNRTDERPRRPIPELGWSMGLWSGGKSDESYAIDFHCGAYSEYVGNSVVMRLPAVGSDRIAARPERALAAYEALVDIWSPEQAVLCEGSIDWDDRRQLVPERTPLAIRMAASS